jgi:hypothetical protein
VDDGVAAGRGGPRGVGVAQVALHHLGLAGRAVQVLAPSRREVVEHADLTARGQEPVGDVRADETRAPGDENLHRAAG